LALDLDVFDRFSTDVIEQDSIALTISGEVEVEVNAAGLRITVPSIHISKDIVVKGFGGAPSIDVLDFEVTLTEQNEVKGILTAKVFNPSIVDVTLGKTSPFSHLAQTNIVFHSLVGKQVMFDWM
jgi:hypothetical protein